MFAAIRRRGGPLDLQNVIQLPAAWHVRTLQLHLIFPKLEAGGRLEAPSVLAPVGGRLACPNYAFELKSLQKEESHYKAVDVLKCYASGVCEVCMSSRLKTNFESCWIPSCFCYTDWQNMHGDFGKI